MTIKKSENSAGFTLIEILIYSGLFALLMSATLIAVYAIMQSGQQSNAQLIADGEANFILRKLDWAIGGITQESDIITPSSGATSNILSINKPGIPPSENPIVFKITGSDITIKRGSSAETPVDSINVTASSLSFKHIPSSGDIPVALKASFYLNEKYYETTKYLRK